MDHWAWLYEDEEEDLYYCHSGENCKDDGECIGNLYKLFANVPAYTLNLLCKNLTCISKTLCNIRGKLLEKGNECCVNSDPVFSASCSTMMVLCSCCLTNRQALYVNIHVIICY